MEQNNRIHDQDRNPEFYLTARHITYSMQNIQTSVMRRDWADIKCAMFLGWVVQKDVKYSTSFFTLALSHKQFHRHSISCYKRRRRAICQRNGKLHSAGGINNKNVTSPFNGTPRHKPLRCQNVGQIMAVSHKRVAPGTTFQAPGQRILRKQFTTRFYVRKERESWGGGGSKLQGITTLICFEIVWGLFHYPLRNFEYKAQSRRVKRKIDQKEFRRKRLWLSRISLGN